MAKNSVLSLRVAQLWALMIGVLGIVIILAIVVGVFAILIGIIGFLGYLIQTLLIFMGVWNHYAAAIMAIIILGFLFFYGFKITIWANNRTGRIF